MASCWVLCRQLIVLGCLRLVPRQFCHKGPQHALVGDQHVEGETSQAEHACMCCMCQLLGKLHGCRKTLMHKLSIEDRPASTCCPGAFRMLTSIPAVCHVSALRWHVREIVCCPMAGGASQSQQTDRAAAWQCTPAATQRLPHL